VRSKLSNQSLQLQPWVLACGLCRTIWLLPFTGLSTRPHRAITDHHVLRRCDVGASSWAFWDWPFGVSGVGPRLSGVSTAKLLPHVRYQGTNYQGTTSGMSAAVMDHRRLLSPLSSFGASPTFILRQRRRCPNHSVSTTTLYHYHRRPSPSHRRARFATRVLEPIIRPSFAPDSCSYTARLAWPSGRHPRDASSSRASARSHRPAPRQPRQRRAVYPKAETGPVCVQRALWKAELLRQGATLRRQ
jgi:hypothetical protein